MRSSDMPGRPDTGQFIAVSPGAETGVARQIALRMLVALNACGLSGDEPDTPLEISIGVATQTARQDFVTARALLEGADHALYTAKLRGRNRVDCYNQAASAD